jgi:hypothetical protein
MTKKDIRKILYKKYPHLKNDIKNYLDLFTDKDNLHESWTKERIIDDFLEVRLK